MPKVTITRDEFVQDRQGRTFADVLNDPEQPLDAVLQFFSDKDRQRRMEESELHHDRAPLAGVVRELESQPAIDRFLSEIHAVRSQRLRQAIGVVVRIVMERRGWKRTGKKGSLGVRAEKSPGARHTIPVVSRCGSSVPSGIRFPITCPIVQLPSGLAT